MSHLWKVLILVMVLLATITLNLVFTRWGSGSSETALISFTSNEDLASGVSQAETFGIFADPYLPNMLWLSLVMGLILPLMLLGLAMYILVRLKAAPGESRPV